MTDHKNPEATNEELNLEQLEEAAGGLYYDDVSLIPYLKSEPKRNKQNLSGASGPGGTSFPKTGITPGPELDQ